MSILIKNGLVVTQNADREVIADGAIYIEKNLIQDIGPTADWHGSCLPNILKWYFIVE